MICLFTSHFFIIGQRSAVNCVMPSKLHVVFRLNFSVYMSRCILLFIVHFHSPHFLVMHFFPEFHWSTGNLTKLLRRYTVDWFWITSCQSKMEVVSRTVICSDGAKECESHCIQGCGHAIE